MRIQPHWQALLCLALLACCSPSWAGESRDSCTGYIDSLPAHINIAGTWCLRGNLATAAVGGGLINISANNAILDCNGYRIEHTDPANTSGAIVMGGNNSVVRQCDVRGFYVGVHLHGPGGSVEDNRFRQIGSMAIYAQGDGAAIRRNHILGVGGRPENNGAVTAVVAYGISDVTDNVIDSVTATPDVHGNASAMALWIYISKEGQISGNRIRNLLPHGTGKAVAIESVGGTLYIRGNHIVGPALASSWYSIRCTGGGEPFALDNIISGFAPMAGSSSVLGCYLMGGSNIDKP